MAWNLLICAFCAGAAVMFALWRLIRLIKRKRTRRPAGSARRVPHPAPARNPAPRQAPRTAPASRTVRASSDRRPGSRAALPPELRFPVCPVRGCRNTAENRRVIVKAGEGEYLCTCCRYRFKPHVKIH